MPLTTTRPASRPLAIVSTMMASLLAACGASMPAPGRPASMLSRPASSLEVLARPGKATPITWTAAIDRWQPERENPYPYLQVTGTPRPPAGGSEAAIASIFQTNVWGKPVEGDTGRRMVLFGQDEALYVPLEQRVDREGDESRWVFGSRYYRVGTYERPGTFKRGTPLTIRLEPWVTLERRTNDQSPAWVVMHLEPTAAALVNRPKLVSTADREEASR